MSRVFGSHQVCNSLVAAAGFMMTNFETDNSNGLKGQSSGPLPFAGWEDPPLGALHHLHQVSHHCCCCFCTLLRQREHAPGPWWKAVCAVVLLLVDYIAWLTWSFHSALPCRSSHGAPSVTPATHGPSGDSHSRRPSLQACWCSAYVCLPTVC